MNQSNQDRELENWIVEFEDWRQANSSSGIDTFCREKHLAPKIAEGLKQHFQMEDDIAKLVEPAPEAIAKEANDLSGSEIGNYQLKKKLGAGGMGTVWLANQSHPVKRKVAIKLIRPDYRSSEVTAQRFEREKQALALMSHTHVAKVFDAGTSENELPYIAMEFIDGQPITEYCTSGQLPLADRLELFLQLCSAIQHAHQNGLLHRDIKPGNILVTEVDGKPCVKVIDFGLVRPSDNWDPEITEADMVVGSPLWMSPEQARGYRSDASANEAKATVDTRADVYSLGVVLYQLLTESGPITYEYYEKATKLELLKTIQDETPELPSARVDKHRFASGKDSTPVSSWANVLRNELDWVTMRALEKDRDRRYPTVAAFADDVRNYLQNEPVTARPPSFTYRLKKLAQRHKAATIAAATVFGLVALSSVGFAWLYSVASNQTAIARKAEADARQAEERNEVALGLLSEITESFNPSRNGAKITPSQLMQLHKFRSSLEELDLSHEPLLEAKLRGFLAEGYAGSGESESAVEQYKRIIDITSKAPDADPRRRIEAKLGLVAENNKHQDGPISVPILEECFKESVERFGENDELSVSARIMLSENSFNGDFDKVTKQFEENLALAKNVLGESHRTTLLAMTFLGKAYFHQRRHQEAIAQLAPAVELANKLFGPNDLRTMNIKMQALKLRHPRESAGELKNLLKDATAKFGPNHSFTLKLRFHQGLIAYNNDIDEAIDLFSKLIDDCAEKYERSHPIILESKINLGRAYFSKAVALNSSAEKRLPASDALLDRAEAVLESATETFEEISRPPSETEYMAWAYVAKVKMAKGNPSDALEIAKHYGNIAKKELSFVAVSTQTLLAVQRDCLLRLDRGDEAIETTLKAYQESLASKQPSYPSANLAYFIAKTSESLGHREQALKYARIAHELFSTPQLRARSFFVALLCSLIIQNELTNSRDFEAAEETARKTLSDSTPSMRSGLIITRASQATLGDALCEQGKFEEGKPYLMEASQPATQPMPKLKKFELQAKSALALCYLEEGDRDKAIDTLTNVRDELKNMQLTPPYQWILKRCQERLNRIEDQE